MKFVVSVLDNISALPMADEELTFDRREDARLAAERYAGKAIGTMLVTEYDDAGNEVRSEEYDPEDGWLSDLGRAR